jgi:hypothetical protein
MRHSVRLASFAAAIVGFGALNANAEVSLLPDPVSATAASTYADDIPGWGPQNLYDQDPTAADLNQVIGNGAEYAGSGEGPHVVVFDYGSPVSFDGMAYAQRVSGADLDADRVPEINFWVANTDPGPAALDLAILSDPPAASVTGIDMLDLAFNSYAFGHELTGQYVVVRLEAGGTFNPGGGEMALLSSIPEPSALALAAVGLLGMVKSRRRTI